MQHIRVRRTALHALRQGRRAGLRALAAVFGLVLSLGAGHAVAATYTVLMPSLDIVGVCTPVVLGASTCTSLRAAVTAANVTTTVDDTIAFSAGGTINITSALPQITDTTIVNGSGIILNGGGGSYSALQFSGAGAINGQLQGITVTNFNQSAVTIGNAANVVLNNNTITQPNDSFDAIRCFQSDNCSITGNNITDGFYGIAVFNNPAVAGYNATVTGNTVTGTNYGVGLLSVSNVIVDNNTISNTNFGGIRLSSQFNPSNTDNNSITNNSISGGVSGSHGITLEAGSGSTVSNNLIQGNTITGNTGAGINFDGRFGAIANSTITGNTITGNGGDGVQIFGANAADNAIYANTNISGNTGLGIDLDANGVTLNDAGDVDTGPNGLQNFPVVTSIAGNAVSFTLDTTANASGYRIDFYNNPGGLDTTGYGEGQVWLGSCIVASPSAITPSTCTIAGVSATTLRMTATRCLTGACTSGATSEFNNATSVDLAISKTEATGTGVIPQNAGMSYNIVVWNRGPATASGAIFTDTVPAGLTGVRWNCVASGSASCGTLTSGSGNSISITTGALPVNNVATPPTSGSYLTIGVTGIVSSSSGFANTAVIATPAGVADSNSGNNSSTANITVVPNQFGAPIPGSVCGATVGAPPPAVSWYHNNPANTLNAGIDNPAIIASGASEVVAGLPGFATANTMDNIPIGAVPATQSGGSYVQHQFTTANYSQYTELTQIGFGTFVPEIAQSQAVKTGTYQAQIQISTDSAFATSTTLSGTITVHDSGSPQAVTAFAPFIPSYETYNFVRLNVPVPVRLLPATTYYIRIYPFNDTVAGFDRPVGLTNVVTWDDFTVFANQCASATVSLNKTTNGGVGGPFNFALTNTTQATGTVTTTVVATPTQVDGDTVTAGTQAFTVTTPNTDITINENTLPAGWSLGGATCTSAGNPVGSLTGATYTIPAASVTIGATITCTFTNARQPILRLQKQLPNGRFVAADQFTLGIGASTVTTTGSTNTPTETVVVNPATIGTSYTFTEVAAAGANLANYAVTYTCINARSGGQTPSGSAVSFNLTPVAGDDLTCTFVNTRNPLADLSITKSNATNTVTRGTTTTYTVVVTNNGPDAVTGAVVRDPAQAGLTCNDPVSCTGSGCPSPTVPLSTLQSTGGVILGTVANGGTVTFTLSCAVQ